jgi:hypothetical protein
MAKGRFSIASRLHAAALAYIPVILGRMGRVPCLALRGRPFGASGERQHDQERGESSSPLHSFLQIARPVFFAVPSNGSILPRLLLTLSM